MTEAAYSEIRFDPHVLLRLTRGSFHILENPLPPDVEVRGAEVLDDGTIAVRFTHPDVPPGPCAAPTILNLTTVGALHGPAISLSDTEVVTAEEIDALRDALDCSGQVTSPDNLPLAEQAMCRILGPAWRTSGTGDHM